jgi:hypothetical protein
LLRFEQLEDRTAPASYFTLQNPGPLFTQEGEVVSLHLNEYLQYTQPPPETAGSIAFTASGLPPGLTLDALSGVITGSPDYSIAHPDQPSVDFTITLTASDGTESDSVTFTWTILDAPDQGSPNGSGTGSDNTGTDDSVPTASIDETDALLNLLIRWYHASSGTTEPLPSEFDSSLTLSDVAFEAYSRLGNYPAVASFLQEYIYDSQAIDETEEDTLNYIAAPNDLPADPFEGHDIEAEIGWQTYLDWLGSVKAKYPGEPLGVRVRTDDGELFFSNLARFEDQNLPVDQNLLYLAFTLGEATDSTLMYEECGALAIVEPVSRWGGHRTESNQPSYETVRPGWTWSDAWNIASGIFQVGIGVVLLKTGVGSGVGAYMIYRGVDTAWKGISSDRRGLTETLVRTSTKWVTGDEQLANTMGTFAEGSLVVADITLTVSGLFSAVRSSLLFQRLTSAANAGQRVAFTVSVTSESAAGGRLLANGVEKMAFISASSRQAGTAAEVSSSTFTYIAVKNGNKLGVIRANFAKGPAASAGTVRDLTKVPQQLEQNFQGVRNVDRLKNAVQNARPGAAAEATTALELKQQGYVVREFYPQAQVTVGETTRTVRPDMIAEKDGVRYIVEVKDWNAWNFSQGIQESRLEALRNQVEAYAEYARHLGATTGQVHKFRLHFHHFPTQGDTSKLLQELAILRNRYADLLEITGVALP